jgi:hypothetical protein
MFFDVNARVGDWREQVLHCRDKGVSISRQVTFALAVADLLLLPDDVPLMPAVAAAVSVPTRLSDPASIARLRIVAHAAARAALANDDESPRLWAAPPIEPVIESGFDNIKSFGGSGHYRDDEAGRNIVRLAQYMG